VETREDGAAVLRAESSGAASGLYHEIAFDPEEYPYLSWEWKIEHTVERGDALSKEGDDYAARVYVVFPSIWFWKTRAINYIWANKLPRGRMVENAFTGNAMMIAVESGEKRAGAWVRESRHLARDYRAAFGEDPPRAGAVAVMTDTDNTGSVARAWYGPLVLSAAPLPGP